MKTIPVEQFGRDHWSTLAYIECLCVDNDGVPNRERMRCNPKQHPGLAHHSGTGWQKTYSTRLAGHTLEKPVQQDGHDDWHCADDLEAAGLIEQIGTGGNPAFAMTDKGNEMAARLRAHKTKGGNFDNFTA